MNSAAVEAALLPTTAIATNPVPIADTGQVNCKARPQWWIVDVSVHGTVRDTSAGPPTPTRGELLTFPPSVPLHLRITTGLIAPPPSSAMTSKVVAVDAVTRSYFVYSSSVRVEWIGPPTLAPISQTTSRPSIASPTTAFGLADVGILPCGEHPRSPSRGHFTWRERVADGATPVLPIPAGARAVQLQDSAGPLVYAWLLNPTLGVLPVAADGLSPIVLVPGAIGLQVAPGRARDVIAVWEIDV